MQKEKILVMGACGQIGVELTLALRKMFGNDAVIASDIRGEHPMLTGTGPYITLNATDAIATKELVKKEGITQIYLLAALLSATGEKDPKLAWELNMESLRQVLDLAVEEKIKVFWPFLVRRLHEIILHKRQSSNRRQCMELQNTLGNCFASIITSVGDSMCVLCVTQGLLAGSHSQAEERLIMQ